MKTVELCYVRSLVLTENSSDLASGLEAHLSLFTNMRRRSITPRCLCTGR